MSTAGEQLNRLLRELGESLAVSLGARAASFKDIFVDLTRGAESQVPAMTVVGVSGETRTSIPPPPHSQELVRRVAALGGRYRHWLHITVHFHGTQLPIPMGVTVRPDDHHHQE
jgi:hypothetical protein